MKTKKVWAIILVVLVVALSAVVFVACDKGENDTIDVVIVDGAPALAVANLMREFKTYENYTINYKVVGGADALSDAIANGDADIAIAPTNLGAKFFNSGIDIKLASTNIQGLLYMVGKTEVASLNELVGKVVYNIGRGQTPDLTFKYILQQKGIEYVDSETPVEGKVALHYVSGGGELIPALKVGKAQYGILGEPAVTKAKAAAGVQEIFNIQALWNEVTNSNANFPQASTFVLGKYKDAEYSALVNAFITKMEENVTFMNSSAENLTLAIDAVKALYKDTATANVNINNISRCNLKVVKAQDAKTSVTTYLTVLHGFNAESIGGSVPGDAFFY